MIGKAPLPPLHPVEAGQSASGPHIDPRWVLHECRVTGIEIKGA